MAKNRDTTLNLLVAKLTTVMAFDAFDARSTLLDNIPGKDFIERSQNNKATDLGQIVKFAASLGKLQGEDVLNILKTNTWRYLASGSTQADDIEACFQELISPSQADLPEALAKVETPGVKPMADSATTLLEAEIPFINRQDEMRNLLSSTAPTHYILEAPSGYGKSKLMNMLHTRFQTEQNYKSVLVSVNRDLKENLLLDAIQQIYSGLGLSKSYYPSLSISKDPNDWEALFIRLGDEHAAEIYDLYFDTSLAQLYTGVVLLIDNLDALPNDEIRLLLGKYIPTMGASLGVHEPFNSGGRFRVVASLRYLTKDNNYIMNYLPAKVSLAPFAFNYVNQTVKSVLKPPQFHIDQYIELFTADIMYATAGHPECIIKVLDLYRAKKGMPPVFMQFNSERIWNEIVQPKIEEIRNGIPKHLRPIFSTLSILRVFNLVILTSLIDEGKIQWTQSKNHLADELTGTFLYERRGRNLRDAITRSMFALEQRHLLSEEDFSQTCQKAYELYFSMINQHSDEWVVECFYQYLQKSIPEIEDPQKRTQVEAELYAKIIPEVLGAYLKASEEPVEDLNALLQKIDADWELRFTLNYFLRKDKFDEQPYQKFIKVLNDWQQP